MKPLNEAVDRVYLANVIQDLDDRVCVAALPPATRTQIDREVATAWRTGRGVHSAASRIADKLARAA